ncbi:hypothetical protein SpCBS45565_g03093 [Spizellomyces sp. 'palustris']|nr:hypothetical protein SpCBS45565_g03093 [Spizellomyces sp. 'palustris']
MISPESSAISDTESLDASSAKSATKPKPKRANHNELERKRRQHQKCKLEELKEAVPSLQTKDKPSTVVIMQKAKEYIDQLKRRIVELEMDMDRMRRGQFAGQLTKSYPVVAHGADPLIERLRRENTELKMAVQNLQNQLLKQHNMLQHYSPALDPLQTVVLPGTMSMSPVELNKPRELNNPSKLLTGTYHTGMHTRTLSGPSSFDSQNLQQRFLNNAPTSSLPHQQSFSMTSSPYDSPTGLASPVELQQPSILSAQGTPYPMDMGTSAANTGAVSFNHPLHSSVQSSQGGQSYATELNQSVKFHVLQQEHGDWNLQLQSMQPLMPTSDAPLTPLTPNDLVLPTQPKKRKSNHDFHSVRNVTYSTVPPTNTNTSIISSPPLSDFSFLQALQLTDKAPNEPADLSSLELGGNIPLPEIKCTICDKGYGETVMLDCDVSTCPFQRASLVIGD